MNIVIDNATKKVRTGRIGRKIELAPRVAMPWNLPKKIVLCVGGSKQNDGLHESFQRRMGCFKGVDSRGVFQGQTDIIQPME